MPTSFPAPMAAPTLPSLRLAGGQGQPCSDPGLSVLDVDRPLSAKSRHATPRGGGEQMPFLERDELRSCWRSSCVRHFTPGSPVEATCVPPPLLLAARSTRCGHPTSAQCCAQSQGPDQYHPSRGHATFLHARKARTSVPGQPWPNLDRDRRFEPRRHRCQRASSRPHCRRSAERCPAGSAPSA